MTTRTKPKEAELETTDIEAVEDPLDLTSLVPTRRLVKLPTEASPKGEIFELRLLDDFGIQKQQELMANSRKFNQLLNADRLRSGEQDRLKKLLDDLFDDVLDAPVAVKRAMPDGVRSRVVSAFSWAPQLAIQQAAAKQREKDILTILVKRDLVTQEMLDEIVAEVDSESASES